MTAAEILAGPHLRSLADIGERAPIVVVEPLRFIPLHSAPIALERKLPAESQAAA